MKMMKVTTVILAGIALIIGLVIGGKAYIQVAHLNSTKTRLLELAKNNTATSERLADIHKQGAENWTDDTVGVTGDGYVIYYDLHASHGSDMIEDCNIFYLPDENRFLVNYKHYCVGLRKADQPKNKTELLQIINRMSE